MKKKFNILIIAIISIIVIGVIVITFLSQPIMFLIYLITDDGGKLDDVEKISAVVIENQEALQDIVSQVLNHEQEFRIVIDIEEKYYQNLDSPREASKDSLNLEDIYRLSKKLDIKGIHAYKNPEMDMVIFTTYEYGIVTSAEIKGFFYLEQDLTENVFEYGYFKPYYINNYSEIIDNWYYFEMSC